MMISRSNYEIYFVDYFDGRLNESQRAELFTFLESNSDLKEEFSEFEKIMSLPDDKIIFADKDSLKKNVPTIRNYQTWLVAELENDLDKEQQKSLREFLEK